MSVFDEAIADEPQKNAFDEAQEENISEGLKFGQQAAAVPFSILTNPVVGQASEGARREIARQASGPQLKPHEPNIFERLSEAAPSVFGRPGIRPPEEAPTGLLPNVAQVLYGRQTAPGERPEPGLLRFSPKELIPPQEGYLPELGRQAAGMVNIENIGIIKGLGALEKAPGKAVNLLRAASRAYFAKQGAEATSEAAGKRFSGVEQTKNEKAQEDFQMALGSVMSGVPIGEAVVKLKNSLENVSAGAGKLLAQSINETLPQVLQPEVRPAGETGGRIQPPIGMATLPQALEFTRGGIPVPRGLPAVPQEAPAFLPQEPAPRGTIPMAPVEGLAAQPPEPGPLTYEPSGLGRPEVGELGQGATPAFQGVEPPNILAPTAETGRAAQAVREMSAQKARVEDFNKAVAEKVSQQQEEPIHPDKPLTANQLKIVSDSLIQAVQDNQIPGPRKGLIAGSALDQWANGVLKGSGTHLGPDVAAAYLVRGAAALERGITGFAEWSAHLIREIGEGVIPHLKELFEQSKKYRVEQLTGERKYASGKQETTAVHGDLRPQSGQSEGQVPAKEGGQGVQPQAQEGVQNAAQGSSRILLASEKPEFEALPQLQPGERVVRIVPADGSKPYLASFADKIWDWGGKRMANVGKNVNGKWSHGMLREGDQIVELDQAPESQQAATTLTPAILTPDGRLEGKSHPEIRTSASKQGVDAMTGSPGVVEGFVLRRGPNDKGTFLGRQEAMVEFKKLKPDAKTSHPTSLISEDLADNGLLKHLDEKPGLISGTGLEKWADQQLKGGGTHLGPDVLAAYAVKGAAVIERGITEFSKWSAEMVKQFGEKIKPHLRALYDQSKAIRSQAFERKAAPKAPAPEPPKPAEAPTPEQPQGKSPTSLKNAIVDQERVKRGLAPAMEPARRGFGEVWDQAVKKIDDDPGVVDRLIDSLRSKPRAATDLEDAMLLHRQIELQNDFDKVNDRVVEARERGDDATRVENEVRVAELSDKLKDLYDIGKRTGTENARGLAARKMLANDDFTLASMTVKKRAANQGKPLTDPQQKAIQQAYEKIRKSQKRLDDYLATRKVPAKRTSKIVLDEQGMKLKVENERLKSAFRLELLKDRLKSRNPLEKAQDWWTKYRQAELLSNPITFGKLIAAALSRAVITPTEELVGAGIGALIPKVASKAPREGGFNARAESKAITEGMTKGIRDAWETLRTGKSELDVLYGKDRGIPNSVLDWFGRLHAVIKAPIKRSEFARSFEKQTRNLIENGVDVTNPMVELRSQIKAYQDAQRSIFQQDNRLVEAVKRGIQSLEKRDPVTGRTSFFPKAGATVIKTMLPIMRVPTNLVAETISYTPLGLFSGSARLLRAFYRGAENLKPEEADLIMRHLKKGSIGSAVMLMGFLNPDAIGGYFQPGRKRAKDDVKPGGIKLFGEELPSWLFHNPLLETAQLGATIRRVADSKFRKRDLETQGISAGALAGALGLAEEVPFIRQQVENAKAFNDRERGQFFGEISKSIAVPQFIQWLAKQRDVDIDGNPIERKPTTFGQRIATGIPGLREEVPQRVSR